MLTQTRPQKQKPPQQAHQQKTLHFEKKAHSSLGKSMWEMSPQEALKVNYLVYEHQNIHE